MTAFLLVASHDTSPYLYSAYTAIGVIITAYSWTLRIRARNAKRGENGQ